MGFFKRKREWEVDAKGSVVLTPYGEKMAEKRNREMVKDSEKWLKTHLSQDEKDFFDSVSGKGSYSTEDYETFMEERRGEVKRKRIDGREDAWTVYYEMTGCERHTETAVTAYGATKEEAKRAFLADPPADFKKFVRII